MRQCCQSLTSQIKLEPADGRAETTERQKERTPQLGERDELVIATQTSAGAVQADRTPRIGSACDSAAETRSHPRKDMVGDGEGCLHRIRLLGGGAFAEMRLTAQQR